MLTRFGFPAQHSFATPRDQHFLHNRFNRLDTLRFEWDRLIEDWGEPDWEVVVEDDEPEECECRTAADEELMMVGLLRRPPASPSKASAPARPPASSSSRSSRAPPSGKAKPKSRCAAASSAARSRRQSGNLSDGDMAVDSDPEPAGTEENEDDEMESDDGEVVEAEDGFPNAVGGDGDAENSSDSDEDDDDEAAAADEYLRRRGIVAELRKRAQDHASSGFRSWISGMPDDVIYDWYAKGGKWGAVPSDDFGRGKRTAARQAVAAAAAAAAASAGSTSVGGGRRGVQPKHS